MREKSWPALPILAVWILATAWAAGGALIADSPVLTSLSFREDFSSGQLDGSEDFQHPEDWTILTEGPRHFLHMLKSREPGVPRGPCRFALLRHAVG